MPANALDGVMPLSTQEQIIPAHNEHEEEVIGVTEAPSLYTSQWQRYDTKICIRIQLTLIYMYRVPVRHASCLFYLLVA